MAFDAPIDGQTPIDDLSGLRLRGIRTQRELNAAEASNIRRAHRPAQASHPAARPPTSASVSRGTPKGTT